MSIFDLQNLKESISEIPMSAVNYPKALLDIADAPQRIYALGDVSLLGRRNIAVVGSRRTPSNALKLGAEITKTLSEEFVILTGVADGGDSAAIEGALRGSGRVICVLAGGFSALPQCNLSLLEKVAKKGLLLALHAFDTPVRAFSYGYRNKMLAALSDGVLVLGAGEKSGALLTAEHAIAYKKPIFAFPYSPNSSSGVGCNGLIKRGAFLTENAEDVAKRYGVDLTKNKKQVLLTADEEALLETLRELCEAHVNELSSKMGTPAFKLRAVLSALEVKGVIVSLGGNRYAIV